MIYYNHRKQREKKMNNKKSFEIKSNVDLVQAVNEAIKESGYKRGWIADQLGMTNQYLSKFLAKKSFSIDDANKILSVIGYECKSEITKK